jgi:hypothetical protein
MAKKGLGAVVADAEARAINAAPMERPMAGMVKPQCPQRARDLEAGGC